jgi:hypothetical protein
MYIFPRISFICALFTMGCVGWVLALPPSNTDKSADPKHQSVKDQDAHGMWILKEAMKEMPKSHSTEDKDARTYIGNLLHTARSALPSTFKCPSFKEILSKLEERNKYFLYNMDGINLVSTKGGQLTLTIERIKAANLEHPYTSVILRNGKISDIGCHYLGEYNPHGIDHMIFEVVVKPLSDIKEDWFSKDPPVDPPVFRQMLAITDKIEFTTNTNAKPFQTLNRDGVVRQEYEGFIEFKIHEKK